MLRSVACFLVCVGALSAKAQVDSYGVGQWLVDLGRDYPLTPQAGVSDADATITLLFMQAASRVEPDLSSAYYWQYDMLDALRREKEAQQALAEYVKRQPDDMAAQLTWIDVALSAQQTAEDRAEFCRSYLKRENLPAPAASELRARLAEYYWNRAETDQARAEAQKSLDLDAFNLRARQLLAEIAGTSKTPLSRIELDLWALRVNPADVRVAVDLASVLEETGLPGEADRWYDYAIRIVKLIPPNSAPADLLTARARGLIDAGKLADAQLLLAEAEKAAPKDITVQLALIHLAAKKGNPAGARSGINKITADWFSRQAAGAGGLNNADIAALAWALVHDVGDAAQASKLVQGLLDDPDAGTIARRVLGATQVRSQQWEMARATLEPIADRDLWAKILLAEALQHTGATAEVSTQFVALATRPADAEQRAEIRKLSAGLAVSLPATQPADPQIQAALAQIQREILDFPFQPDKHLTASWSINPANPQPGDPWLCTLELKNTGSFPIVIGRSAMLVPEVLCWLVTHGDKDRSSGPTIRVRLHGTVQLKPGESLRVTENMLMGSIRGGMIGTPQVTQKVEMTSLTDPLRLVDREGHDIWWTAPGGIRIKPLQFDRRSIFATPELTRSLVAQSQSEDVLKRRMAMAQLAMLLAEQQYLTSGRLVYSVPRIDPAAVLPALLARAADSDWRIRAFFTETMRWIVLDKIATQTVANLAQLDPHWLVRGMAARTLADHYPEKFKPVLERLSSSDADNWVRQFARALTQRALAQRARPAASQPAPQTAAPGPIAPRPADAAAPAPERTLLALPDDSKPAAP